MSAAVSMSAASLRPLPPEEWRVSVAKDGSCVAIGDRIDADDVVHFRKFLPFQALANATHFAHESVEVICEPG